MLTNLFLGQIAEEKNFIEDLFSVHLYTGNGSTQTITNGIDLAGKGGMVWVKNRGSAANHFLMDTNRGIYGYLSSNTTAADPGTGEIQSYNSNGFSLVTSSNTNASSNAYASWTFRKAPKFFDVVTYTGSGSTQSINHNLGVAPGLILIKRTDGPSDWSVFHRSSGSGKVLFFNTTAAEVTSSSYWNNTNPTSTQFTLGSGGANNNSGQTYVAYLFAHDTTADGVIQCGSYTANNGNEVPVTLGWEPQFIIVKNASAATGGWYMSDNMRGMAVQGSSSAHSFPNSSAAEGTATNGITATATGFIAGGLGNINAGDTTSKFIYLAIRRGPMRTPTDATKVYKSVTRTATNIIPWKASGAGFPPDMTIMSGRNLLYFSLSSASIYQHSVIDRLRRATEHIQLVNGDAEGGGWGSGHIHNQDGYDGLYSSDKSYWNASNDLYVDHHFRRSPGFFDIACYTGTGSTRTVTHSLGVAPELIIVKCRNAAGNWNVYCAALSSAASKYMIVNGTGAATTDTTYWSNISPTSSVFTVGSNAQTNTSGGTYVAYLFASCPGVSKIGTYTANGTSLNVDCGFTNGARFVLIKRADGTGAWTVFDTARGITTGNDPYLLLNPTAAAEVTSTDAIDPYPQGFTVNQLGTTNLNSGSATYIYLAIA